VGGWPKVVAPVLQYAHSVKYKPEDFPEDLQRRTRASVKQILDEVKNFTTRKMISTRMKKLGGLIPSRPGVYSSKISYGFKA
jgi:hypothetical protein